MKHRKNHHASGVRKVMTKTDINPIVAAAEDPELPLTAAMSAWEMAVGAFLVVPIAATMVLTSGPLLVANLFSRQPFSHTSGPMAAHA
jgi:hypothetical protein